MSGEASLRQIHQVDTQSRRSGPVTGYCRESSAAAGEILAGTAVEETDNWLLVEDTSAWGSDALNENGLPETVAAKLRALGKRERWRAVLIRRPGLREPDDTPTTKVYAIRAKGQDRRWVEFDLPQPEALLDLDVPAELEAAPVLSTIKPIYFVCTHGARDACCAKWGMPLFNALRRRVNDAVWQCSHLGGHRFAPTLLVLPYGLMYGRLEPERVDALVDATSAGSIVDLDFLRGRTCLSQVAQAGEVFLRRALLDRSIDGLELRNVQSRGDQRWEVGFVRPAARGGKRGKIKVYGVTVIQRPGKKPRMPSCGEGEVINYSEYLRA